MQIRELPFGFSTMDSVSGTVIKLKRRGADVLLDDWGDSEEPVYAFVFGASQLGQKVLLSLQGYNNQWGNFVGRLDACIEDAWAGPTAEPGGVVAGSRSLEEAA